MSNKTITIMIVARNEELNLSYLLNDIMNQTYSHNLIDIILVDSMSEDNTRKIMENYQTISDFNILLILENSEKILAAGWNLAIQNSKTDLVVRIDAHASIPKDFIEKNIKVIEKGERASGGSRPNILAPKDENRWQKLLLEAEASIFGSSIAPYRNSKESKYVKSIFHGVYERSIFSEIGLLNTKLGRTEDNDIHYRMRKAGVKLSYNPEIISFQYVRSSLRKMIKQKYSNGYWIGLTMAVQPKCFSFYHFIPLFFLLSLIFSGLVFTCFPWLLVIILGLYISLLSVITLKITITNKRIIYLMLPFIIFLLHISYGMGTLHGLMLLPFKIKKLKQ